MRGRTRRTLTVAVAVVLAVALAAPAVGAPSPLGIAKTALRIAKKADKNAKKAIRTARGAEEMVGPADVILLEPADVSAPPSDFARWDASCPANYVATSVNQGLGALEATYVGSYGRGVIVSMFNTSDTTAYSGTVQVVCIWGLSETRAASRRYPSRRMVRYRARGAERVVERLEQR